MSITPKEGDLVTCRVAVEANYSGYAGGPVLVFRPGMVGKVKSTMPKVHLCRRPPAFDNRTHFLVVDYRDPITGATERVCLNYCNAKVVKRAEYKPHKAAARLRRDQHAQAPQGTRDRGRRR